jgi:FkbM family methyltransferase
MIRCAPAGRHIAYEPIPALHEDLVRHFPQVDVRCAALSNAEGEATFTVARDRLGYSGFRRRSPLAPEECDTVTVRTERLDEALPTGYAPRLIKIDVEGAERQVIEGALETIARHKPIVVFEHGRGAADTYGTEPSHIFGLLCADAGLRMFDIDGNGPLSLAEFDQAFASGKLWNYVAHE